MQTLITKLPAAASDETLYKMDELHFHVKFASGTAITARRFVINNNGIAKIPCRIVGDGYFTNSDGSENLGKEVLASLAVFTYLSEGEYDLYIGDKYRLSEVNFTYFTRGSVLADLATFKCLPACFQFWCGKIGGLTYDEKFDVDEIDLSFIRSLVAETAPSYPTLRGHLSSFKNSSMTRLSTQYQSLSGETADLSALTSLNTLELANNDVSGDIADLVSSAFVRVDLSLTSVSGTLESLLDKMYAAGRVSGTCILVLQGSSVTYNGTVPTVTKTATFAAGGWSVA